MKSNMFANIDVDFIPEFTPCGGQDQQQYYEYAPNDSDRAEYAGVEYEQAYLKEEELGEYENDYTMVHEEQEEEEAYDENGYLLGTEQRCMFAKYLYLKSIFKSNHHLLLTTNKFLCFILKS